MTSIKVCAGSLVCVCLLAGLPSPEVVRAQSATHVISVPVDQTTTGDLAIISDFFNFSPPGTPVSQSLRRIFMAAIGEMTLATMARITPDAAALRLDDGSVVPLLQGDTIQTQGRQPPPLGPGPIFDCEATGNPKRKCQPAFVCSHIFGSPVPICMPVPPSQLPPEP